MMRQKIRSALTSPLSKNMLSKLLSLGTVKRPVVLSSVARVAFWYAWKASVASNISAVPTILFKIKLS